MPGGTYNIFSAKRACCLNTCLKPPAARARQRELPPHLPGPGEAEQGAARDSAFRTSSLARRDRRTPWPNGRAAGTGAAFTPITTRWRLVPPWSPARRPPRLGEGEPRGSSSLSGCSLPSHSALLQGAGAVHVCVCARARCAHAEETGKHAPWLRAQASHRLRFKPLFRR